MSICIMAGGSGERFWPFSRATRPKQLLSIIGNEPLIVETAKRCSAIVPKEKLFIVTTKKQVSDTRNVLPDLPDKNIIAEPYGRNTAPCIGLISALLAADDPNMILGVIPADHWIPDVDIYSGIMLDAAKVAEEKHALVTIGIQPRQPETGYGYILAGERLEVPHSTVFSKVDKFIEKPEKKRAEDLISTERSFWNAGMFVFKVADMLDAFRKFMPEFYESLKKINNTDGNLENNINEIYASAPSISIDYAIMEKADNVIVAHGEFNWDDVGSWSSVANHWCKDEFGNSAKGDYAAVDSTNCVIGNEGDGIVGVVGMDNVIVVRT
ncbi:MAG: mannose-1-phosphate guanylyltransferase, partial [Victivallaceae bacterium]|nr:mannose-1-phosphate guanylyltransferase [Victivallaceae bacterium]